MGDNNSKNISKGVLILGKHKEQQFCGVQTGNWVLTSGLILGLDCLSDENQQKLINEGVSSHPVIRVSKRRFQILNEKLEDGPPSLGNINSYKDIRSTSQSSIGVLNRTFFSGIVYENLRGVFNNWKVNSEQYSMFTTSLLRILFSTLVLLKIEGDETTRGNESDIDIMKLFLKLTSTCRDFYRGLDIMIESTPFALQPFLNSWSAGIVSNTMGKGCCLFLTDARLIVGSEGAPIYRYNNGLKGDLLGMVLTPLLYCKGEWSGYTLAINIYAVLSHKLHRGYSVEDGPLTWMDPSMHKKRNLLLSGENATPVSNQSLHGNVMTNGARAVHIRKCFSEKLDRSIVVVKCGVRWGSGVILDVELGLILTCAHVLNFGMNNNVSIQCKNYDLDCKVVYCSEEDQPYDLAVLQGKLPSDLSQLTIAKDPPVKGEVVFCVGFPLFRNRRLTISKGRVANLVPDVVVHTTCCVHSGNSGGAIIRPNGQLLAMPVNNFNCTVNNAVYPHCNLAIPSSVFAKPIELYSKTNNVDYLSELTTRSPIAQREWNFKEYSKL